MNYEKKYKEALERARKLYEQGTITESLCYVFPELKESEDERTRKAILSALNYLETELGWDFIDDVDILDAYAWLEKQGGKQKPQRIVSAEAKESMYDKPTWSEDDEYQINTILHELDLKRELCKKVGNKVEEYRYDTQYNWLKSLKDGYTWKPSDEQIQCLYDAVEHYQTNGYPATKLKELYEQMQKIYKL